MWPRILAILRRGSNVELKMIGGRVDVVEIRRTIKYRMPLPTGEADG